MAISGRYILDYKIFEFINEGVSTGEIELTSALDNYCKVNKLLGLLSNNKKFDVGSKEGYYRAFIELG